MHVQKYLKIISNTDVGHLPALYCVIYDFLQVLRQDQNNLTKYEQEK